MTVTFCPGSVIKLYEIIFYIILLGFCDFYESLVMILL